MRLEQVVGALDAYFRVPDVRDDDWSDLLAQVYPEPYWRRYAWHSLIPAILATAYHSFVGSNGPVNN